MGIVRAHVENDRGDRARRGLPRLTGSPLRSVKRLVAGDRKARARVLDRHRGRQARREGRSEREAARVRDPTVSRACERFRAAPRPRAGIGRRPAERLRALGSDVAKLAAARRQELAQRSGCGLPPQCSERVASETRQRAGRSARWFESRETTVRSRTSRPAAPAGEYSDSWSRSCEPTSSSANAADARSASRQTDDFSTHTRRARSSSPSTPRTVGRWRWTCSGGRGHPAPPDCAPARECGAARASAPRQRAQ